MRTPSVELSSRQRLLILGAAFLGWLGAGVEMGLGPLAGRPALSDLLFREGAVVPPELSKAQEAQVGVWFSGYLCAFLLGAALGGLLLGRLGDRRGRVWAMAVSILCFSAFTGLSALARTPAELLALRFVASLGIGGMWPCGVALVAEAWPGASRPAVAGVMGMAANVGILLVALAGQLLPVTPDSWRWAMLGCAAPLALGLLVPPLVPESPRWLARRSATGPGPPARPLTDVFCPPLLRRTLLGILLGTVPLVGTWASGKWLVPWTEKCGADPARTQAVWAAGAVLGAAAGGWLASRLGRRTTYFLISLATLGINLAIYQALHPGHPAFLPLVFLLGLVATVFFGWLPLYLPELFPTAVRATGAGVAFNFGRFASAAGVLGAGTLMTLFEGDYARVGLVSSWVYALGMVVILFAPDTSRDTLED
jgi:MFS family permease